MNRIEETQEEDPSLKSIVDQFSTVQSPPKCNRNSIYSSKQTRSKYQTSNRPSSLSPTRHSSSADENIEEEVKQRRRYASDSQTKQKPDTPALLVSSFLQYLRNELRATTSDRKNDYHKRIKQSLSNISIIMNSKLSDENFSELNDQNEILTLIDLLVLRVECITNESKKNSTNHPTVAEVDQNLIEYLYYLFTKFTHDDSNDTPMSIIDKHSFVSVCQTLVRNGCLEAVSASPDQSFSEATLTSDSDQTITPETFLHEYQNVADEQDAWLVVDLKPAETPRILPTSTSDEQLVSTNDTDKSYESVSSPSIYLSPNASLIDIQNMAQEFDEINNHDGSTSNVMNESKTSVFNDDAQSLFLSNHDICIGLTNDENSIEENSEQMIIDDSERMSRREKKMQERWSISTKNDDKTNEQSSNKPILGIEFPQISVLRRKFSSSSTANKKKINPEEEINTSPMTITVDNTNPDQINELLSKDLPVSTNIDVDENKLDEQIPMKKQQDPLLSSVECQIGTITNINNDRESNPIDSNLLLSSIVSSSSPRLIPISSPSSLQLTANENDSFEPLLKEKEEEEEEKKKEEEQRCNDDYNLDEEKKNNSSFVHNYHASRILLINDEPTPTALLKQEKKEKKEERERASSPPLPTLEQFNQQRTEDESPLPTLSNELNPLAMTTTTANTDNDERFKKVEIEEIPDDEEEETVLAQNIDSIEPTDYIHTDDVPTKKSTQSNTTTTISDDPIKFDKVFSCYEKALSKVVDGTHDESSASTQPLANDPIALRALKRFEERMNAAAAAAGTKTTREEPNSLATKGKSSWSGSLSTPRKSVENLFKTSEAQQQPAPPPQSEESSTITSEGYIRPRKTFDDNTLNYGTTTSSINDQNNNQVEEQLQPTAIVETDDKREVIENTSPPMEQTQEIVHENENVIETSSSAEQSTITPYRFQLEGRRRLNTLERMRERRQSRESLDTPDEKQQQIQSAYTLKPEEVQDPIIRRALERFDEKNRTLTQTKSMNYDEIQDPITRRALMRLESNLKRTNPPPPSTTTLATNNSNENWYTENYTLGSLQPTNDRLSRYTDASQSPKTTYISVHQHYLTPSSNNDQSEITTTNESDVQTVRAPTQPIYLTSTNQPLSLRQRSRSEDMLSSKDLTIGQTTNLDDIDTSAQLQRNRSSNEIAVSQAGTLMPNSLIKILEPNFVRTTESSVSYATPTQTYSAYSCEYTRPRRNQTIGSSDTSTNYQPESSPIPSVKYAQPQNDIQRPTPYRPTQPTSAFAPIQSSVATATTPTPTNYYSQQPLPTTQSYSSMYSSNNLNQPQYTEDPIIRRALERFNSQMQSSYPATYQYQPTNNYLPRQGIQGTSFHDPYLTSNRMTTSTTSTSSGSGYQSIIGRRRQTRHDEPNNYFVDNPSVGDAYSSSLFSNAQSQYPINNHYMNMHMNDEPPAIPPRFRRNEETIDHYRRHSTDEYLADNININNNNNNNSQTLPRNAYIHHAYPATITNATGFRPINMHYNQISADQEEYPDGAQLISSTNSSESLIQQRLNHLRNEQRLPSSASATMIVRKPNEQITANKSSPDQSPSDQSASPGDSVFHRLAYTGTKASLSRSSSNSCSNLLNKNAPQNPPNQLQSCEIDFDDSSNTTIIDHTNEQIATSSSNKYQRSKSVDTRGRLKLAQARSNNEMEENLDQQPRVVPSSKFTPVNIRPPLTPRTKPSSNSLRTPNSNGIFYDTDNNQQQEFENNENISYNDDNYQSKLLDNRTRTTLPVHRYSTNNIQPSLSTSAVNSNISRTKPLTTPINLDRRDSNGSSTDPNRTSRRLEDNRLVSPNGQRRNIPVSVFSPAKLDNKRPAPAPPAPAYSFESQQPTSYLSREHELPSKPSSSGVKTPTGNLLNEYPLASDKHDHSKKMNVFERLFRGNKKKN